MNRLKLNSAPCPVTAHITPHRPSGKLCLLSIVVCCIIATAMVSPNQETSLFCVLLWRSRKCVSLVTIPPVQRGIWVSNQHFLWHQGKPPKTLIVTTFKAKVTLWLSSPFWFSQPDVCYCLMITVVSLWGTLCDERSGLLIVCIFK
jgi:hypothetical protein